MIRNPGLPNVTEYRFKYQQRWLKVLGILALAPYLTRASSAQFDGREKHLDVQGRIGLEGLPEELYRVLGFSVRNDSSFVILNGDEPFVWLFSPTGRVVRRWGMKGGGPGEFRAPRMLGRRGDSIWVWDSGLARLTVFSEAGRLTRTLALPSAGQATLLSTGQVSVHTIRNFGPNGESRSNLKVRPLDRTGQSLGLPLFQADYAYGVLQYRRAGSTMVGIQPFEDGALFTACGDGSGFVYVDRQIAHGSSSQTFGVTRIGPDGGIRYFVRIQYAPVLITSALMQRAVTQLLRDGPPSKEPDLEKRIRAAIDRPPHLPTVSRVLCGTDGSVWLRREEQMAESIRWTILDERGTPVTYLTLNRSINPMSVTRNHLWTFEGDENSLRAFVLWKVR